MGGCEVARLIEHAPGAGDGAEHQAVPRSEDLVVETRAHPLAPVSENLLLGGSEGGLFGLLQLGAGPAEDVLILQVIRVAVVDEVSPVGHPVVFLDDGELFLAEEFFQFDGGEAVEFALFTLGVGVLRGVEAALRVGHVTQDVAEDITHHLGMALLSADQVGIEVELHELGIVVEHFFEVGDQPLRVGGVTCEAATDVVVNSARCHLVTGEQDLVDGLLVAKARSESQHEAGLARRRKFRRCAPAALYRIEAGFHFRERVAQHIVVELGRATGHGIVVGLAILEELGKALRGLVDVGAVADPSLDDIADQGVEGRVREVGATKKRFELGSEKGAQGPAAAPLAERLDGRHVNLVDVRAFLAVDLDTDEVFIEVFRGGLVLEGLAFHHVAPVAGRITDAEEDGLVLFLRLLERLGAPREPIDRVVGVLQQVGRLLVRQPVGVLGLCVLVGFHSIGIWRAAETQPRGEGEHGGAQGGGSW